MSSLSISYGGIELDNPLIIASSPATESVEGIIRCSKMGAGAVITKSVADYDKSVLSLGARRTHFDSRGFWATSTFRRETLSRDEGKQLVTRASLQTRVPIIASVTAMDLNPDCWVPTCLDLQNAGASMIQLDLFYLPQPACTDSSMKRLLGLFDVLAKAVSVPIIPKLNVGIPAYLAARHFRESNIAGISLLDSVRVPSPIDMTRKGSTLYRFIQKPGMSSVFGSWQLPLTQHYTMILGRLTDLPLCVGGGLTDAHDALEMVMLGATTVQYATAILIRGYGLIRKLVRDLEDLLDRLGYDSITDAQGIALQNQRTDFEGAMPIFEKARANVDRNKCTMCRECISLTFCNAISEQEGHIHITDSLCDGCGFCLHFCKSKAFNIECSLVLCQS